MNQANLIVARIERARQDRGISVADLNKKLGEKGIEISNGYGDLKEKTFRISHMADMTMDDMKLVTSAIEEVLGL